MRINRRRFEDRSSFWNRIKQSKRCANEMDGWLLALVVGCLVAARAAYCTFGITLVSDPAGDAHAEMIGMELATAALISGPLIGSAAAFVSHIVA